MEREQIKTILAWLFIVVAVFVMTATTRGKYLTRPMIPQLVPFFGAAFAILFVVAQAGVCLALGAKAGLAWIAGMLLLGYLGGAFGQAVFSFEAQGYDWARHRIVTGACVSGLVLGIQFLRGKL